MGAVGVMTVKLAIEIRLLLNFKHSPGADGTPDPVVVESPPIAVDEVSIVVESVGVAAH